MMPAPRCHLKACTRRHVNHQHCRSSRYSPRSTARPSNPAASPQQPYSTYPAGARRWQPARLGSAFRGIATATRSGFLISPQAPCRCSRACGGRRAPRPAREPAQRRRRPHPAAPPPGAARRPPRRAPPPAPRTPASPAPGSAPPPRVPPAPPHTCAGTLATAVGLCSGHAPLKSNILSFGPSTVCATASGESWGDAPEGVVGGQDAVLLQLRPQHIRALLRLRPRRLLRVVRRHIRLRTPQPRVSVAEHALFVRLAGRVPSGGVTTSSKAAG
jgi:hypothetical protein